MNWVDYKIVFDRDLTEDEEEQLIANFKGLVDLIIKDLKNMRLKLSSNIVSSASKLSGVSSQLKMLLDTIDMLCDNWKSLFILKKENNKVYVFSLGYISLIEENVNVFSKILKLRVPLSIPKSKLKEVIERGVLIDFKNINYVLSISERKDEGELSYS